MLRKNPGYIVPSSIIDSVTPPVATIARWTMSASEYAMTGVSKSPIGMTTRL